MTDGGDTVINMARFMAPASEPALDGFHITMRITVLPQSMKGPAHHNTEAAENPDRLLRRSKGFLWHGHWHEGQAVIADRVDDLETSETNCASIKALRKAAGAFQISIANNRTMIPNPAERHALWSACRHWLCRKCGQHRCRQAFWQKPEDAPVKAGAHRRLQTRTRTLGGTLHDTFASWHPGLTAHAAIRMAA